MRYPPEHRFALHVDVQITKNDRSRGGTWGKEVSYLVNDEGRE